MRSEGACMRSVFVKHSSSLIHTHLLILLMTTHDTTHDTLAHGLARLAQRRERPPVRSEGACMRSVFVNHTTHNTGLRMPGLTRG